MRRSIIALLLCAPLLLSSCNKTPGADTTDSGSATVENPATQEGTQPGDPFIPRTLTEDKWLSYYWENGIRELSVPVMNGATGPDNMSMDEVLRCCAAWLYRRDQQGMTLEDSGGWRVNISDLEQASGQLFGIDQLAFSDRMKQDYEIQNGTLLLYVYLSQEQYDEGVLRLVSVDLTDETHLIAHLERQNGDTVDRTATAHLEYLSDGTLRFLSGEASWVQTSSLSFSGSYIRLPESDADKLKESYHWVQLDSGLKACACEAYDQNYELYGLNMMSFDSNTLQVVDQATVDTEGLESVVSVKAVGNQVVVLTNIGVFVFGSDLELQQQIVLPACVSEAYYFSYDINDSFTQFAYIDQEGAKLCSLSGAGQKVIAYHKNAQVSDTMQTDAYTSVRFVADGRKVLLSRSGYEWNLGYLLCDLSGGISTEVDTYSDVDSFVSSGESAFILAGGYATGDRAGQREHVYLNYETGEMIHSDAGSLSGFFFEYAAFDTQRYLYYFDSQSYREGKLASAPLMQLDLQTGKIRTTSFSVSGFDYLQIYWADEDELVFSAIFQGEQATCLVPLLAV